MVKIRYSELPAGLHVTTEAGRRGTVVYLLPGLTPAQRRAALIRVRSSAIIGQGPDLPAVAIAVAIAADRVRTTARNSAAAMRGHPVLVLPPIIAVVSIAIAVMLMSGVTLTVAPHDKAAASLPTLPLGGSAPASHRPAGSMVRHPGASERSGRTGPSGTASRTPSASGSALAAPSADPPASTPSPSPEPSSQSSSPSPSASGSCIKLGPLGLCVNV